MSEEKDERDRILRLVERGQITAEQAAQLLDALSELDTPARMGGRRRDPVILVRATSLNERRQPLVVHARLPLHLLRVSTRLGLRLIPSVDEDALDELLGAIEQGAGGRMLDLQDLERGERVEIFVEQ